MIEPVLVPFKAEHWMTFVHFAQPYQQEFRAALHKENGGPAFTAVLDNNVVACAGIIIHHKGMGYAWSIFEKNLIENKRLMVWVTRTVGRILPDIKRSLALHRIEMIVDAEEAKHHRWAEKLGFSQENGRARMFTPDKHDVLRYEMVDK